MKWLSILLKGKHSEKTTYTRLLNLFIRLTFFGLTLYILIYTIKIKSS